MEPGLQLYSRRVVTPEGVCEATVVVRGERIAEVVAGKPQGAGEVLDLGERALLPGVVDCHAHLNEPGRTEWEGFETGTQACAAGGTTTVVDMPLNSVPATTSAQALEEKAASAARHAFVDHGFWGGVVPGNSAELAPMARAGVAGFKCFLVESGVEEFRCVQRSDLEVALPELARLGVPLIAHAELDVGQTCAPSRTYRSYLASRPDRMEVEAISLLVELCRAHQARVHIVHLSSAQALPLIRAAKGEGLPFSVETCPHYLTFAAEEIPDGATHFKCAPPIRERANRELLWEAVKDGTIDLVVSDHSPCTPELKRMETGDFDRAWGGISSLQLSLSAVWTGMSERGLGLDTLCQRMSEAPARLCGLFGQKGAIRAGFDADLVVFDPDARAAVDAAHLRHRHKVTPYAGRSLRGQVHRTILRGETIFEDGKLKGLARGQRLRRRAS